MSDQLEPKRQEFFRANVDVIVIDRKGLVISFRRKGKPSSWQFPQGIKPRAKIMNIPSPVR